MLRYLFPIITLLVFFNCELPTAHLEIRSINNNQPLLSDLQDWGREWTGSSWVTEARVCDDIVPIEIALVAVGGTINKTFSVQITSYEVSFTHIAPDTPNIPVYSKVTGAINFYLSSDDKRPFQGSILICPQTFKQTYFDEMSYAVLKAKITLKGRILYSNEEISATGYLTIIFADHPDDQTRFGG
jgi:hypothetical protein